ncbi:MAG: NADP-dependent malic enzyme [Candidatus Kapabacteria bacterium]|nr:NADP-dependent malic enzyme [Ignavibacteriota bacterium]MCW5885395.1 NADP-dependent malic enzyme [Candidatus Kapabacteria bacterium]
MKISREDALEYHSMGRKGKIEVIPTKPTATQRDLSLAYSPGVAEPCREIFENPENVFKYTAKGNLVAVVSNGTAVLGLGDLGALGGKPVMEGKGLLFKIFADIDVFDIEIESKSIDEIIRTVELISPTFGGINLEDIKGPECFEIEEALKKKLDIPVFHDDQHGTAIISGAALLNACEITGKKIDEVKVVVNGAGASGIACAKFHISLGVNRNNVLMCDSKGVIYKGRTAGMNHYKEEFAVETDCRTLEDAMRGADVFIGLSQADCVTPEMLKSMNNDPVVFAMANPDPEIRYDIAVATRNDVIMATGRSDYPNQVNNVLGFPFIFRGALDVHATAINEEMKKAAAYALADLAKEEVPESVMRIYNVDKMSFGREYIIPKPFDPRVLTRVAPAVAKAAMDSGVARTQIDDFDKYRSELDIRMGRAYEFMYRVYQKAKKSPKKIVLPEGDNPKIIKAATLAKEMNIAQPILLGDFNMIKSVADKHAYDISNIEIIDPKTYSNTDKYVHDFYILRQRKGFIKTESETKILGSRNYFGSMMVRSGDADGMVTGVTQHYPDALRPSLEVVGRSSEYKVVSGLYLVKSKNKMFFLADTTVNIDPTGEELADITLQTAKFANYFDIEPKVALLSYSNFGSAKGEIPDKLRQALKIIKEKSPELMVDGEMQADTAVVPEIIERTFPFSNLKGGANVLIFPNLSSGNIAYKLLNRVGGSGVVGPILLGMNKPINILQRDDEVDQIIDMIAITAMEAQKY